MASVNRQVLAKVAHVVNKSLHYSKLFKKYRHGVYQSVNQNVYSGLSGNRHCKDH